MYVYRFLDSESNVIYVGKAVNLKQRMTQHFSEYGHLPIECYKKVKKIQYLKFNNSVDMTICELFYINVYKPTYNVAEKIKGSLEVDINMAKHTWIYFGEGENITGQRYENEEVTTNELIERYNNTFDVKDTRRIAMMVKRCVSTIDGLDYGAHKIEKEQSFIFVMAEIVGNFNKKLEIRQQYKHNNGNSVVLEVTDGKISDCITEAVCML